MKASLIGSDKTSQAGSTCARASACARKGAEYIQDWADCARVGCLRLAWCRRWLWQLHVDFHPKPAPHAQGYLQEPSRHYPRRCPSPRFPTYETRGGHGSKALLLWPCAVLLHRRSKRRIRFSVIPRGYMVGFPRWWQSYGFKWDINADKFEVMGHDVCLFGSPSECVAIRSFA